MTTYFLAGTKCDVCGDIRHEGDKDWKPLRLDHSDKHICPVCFKEKRDLWPLVCSVFGWEKDPSPSEEKPT